MSVYFNNRNQWNLAQTAIPGAQQAEPMPETFETQDEKGKTEIAGSISYAETTWLRVDEQTRKTLHSYGGRTISSWAGKNLEHIIDGRQIRITVRDARIINSKAKTELIKINAENVVEFTVDPIIRDRLKPLSVSLLEPDLEELGGTDSDFCGLKRGNGTRTIKKVVAEKYNNYFQKHKLGADKGNTKVFDLERIFNLAYNEPIVEKTKKLSIKVFIKLEADHRRKLRALPLNKKNRIIEKIGKNFKNIANKAQSISIIHAVLIHKISGEEIFDFREEAVQKFSIHKDQVTELKYFSKEVKEKKLIIDQEMRTKIYNITSGRTETVSVEQAEQLNSYLSKNNQFNVESILFGAIREAEEEAKLPTPSRGTKRRLSASNQTPEDSVAQSSKRQRTDADVERRTAPDVNGFHPNYLTPPLVYRDPFSLPPPTEAPPVQVVHTQIAPPQEFSSPLDLPANGENEQSFSSPSYSDLFDLGFDDGMNSNQFSPVGLGWDEWDLYLNA